MPSGKVHDKITVVGAVVTAPAWYFLTPAPHEPSVGATLIVSLLFAGLMLSPDLDLNSSIYHRWGPLKWLWWPYQKAVPHRSFLSHSWLLGPILRVAYFLLLLWGVAHLFVWGRSQLLGAQYAAVVRTPIDMLQDGWRLYPDHVAWGLVGVLIGTALHTAADGIVTGIKRRL
jgi:uncharacterized metal-binding protein